MCSSYGIVTILVLFAKKIRDIMSYKKVIYKPNKHNSFEYRSYWKQFYNMQTFFLLYSLWQTQESLVKKRKPRNSKELSGTFRKRIREKVFEDLIERSEVSLKVMSEGFFGLVGILNFFRIKFQI